MAPQTQSYSSHRRYYPLYHFVVEPILLANLFVEAARLYKYQTLYHVWLVLVAFALVALAWTARVMVLRAQNRVIRLEERLRLARLVPPSELGTLDNLTPRQLIALRFASDEELPDLARRSASGELASSDDIKKAIREWRADELRV